MVTPVTKYQTTDGKEFSVESEANSHQAFLDNQAKIEAFLDKYYPRPAEGKPGPTRAIAGKAIAQFLGECAAEDGHED